MYSGNLNISTKHMGGEGIECKETIYIYGGNLVCNTFDDGINVEKKMNIFGGNVYCNSSDNDGIDSNGRLFVDGGTVVSISQHVYDESFDAEKGLMVTGGRLFGIGRDDVVMCEGGLPMYTRHRNGTQSGTIVREASA